MACARLYGGLEMGLSNRRVLFRGILTSLLIATLPLPLAASRVSPMIVEMTPSGRGSVGRVELTNDASRDIAYEVQMMRGDISTAGELTLTPADEQFIVFPPQSLIEANSQQVFRVQYVGEDALDSSQIYYLAVRQIPVAFEEGQNEVQVVVNYNVLVNVVPEGTQPQPITRAARYVERPKPSEDLADEAVPEDKAPESAPIEKGILVDLGNEGTRYYFAGRADWEIAAQTVTGQPFTLSLNAREVAKFTGVGVIGPGKTRQFFIPTEQPLQSESIRISIKL